MTGGGSAAFGHGEPDRFSGDPLRDWVAVPMRSASGHSGERTGRGQLFGLDALSMPARGRPAPARGRL
jgi:hypothetical protein